MKRAIVFVACLTSAIVAGTVATLLTQGPVATSPADSPAEVRRSFIARGECPDLVVAVQSQPVGETGWRQDWSQAAYAQLCGSIQVYSFGPEEWQAIAAKRVVLWPFTRTTNHGRDPPNIPQPVGDCVSRGWSHGLEDALATHCYLTGRGEFVRVYPPYIYGASRVWIGKGQLGYGDGSTGHWAAKAVEQYGVLEWTDDLPAYTSANIRKWGYEGPPHAMAERGKKHLAQTRLITNFEAACVAISHGSPVAVCCNVGFNKIVEANDRIEGRQSGSWSHCQVFRGFDARPGMEALYCYNSWGPNAHAPADRYAALDAAPPGGYWVPRAVAEAMLRANDSYAISFSGFTHPQSDVIQVFGVLEQTYEVLSDRGLGNRRVLGDGFRSLPLSSEPIGSELLPWRRVPDTYGLGA